MEAAVGTQRIKSLPPSGEAWEDFTEELIVTLPRGDCEPQVDKGGSSVPGRGACMCRESGVDRERTGVTLGKTDPSRP